jgi:hypothetical protein
MINESKLNVRMLHLMESGFFGKQLLNEASLSLNLNTKIRIFQSFYNYWDAGSNTILVDGNTGGKTKVALEATMKKWAKNAFNKENIAAIYSSILRQTSSKNLANLKNLKDEHNARFFQAVLCLAGNTSVIPDGVIGNNTKTIMRSILGSDETTKVSDDKLRTLISTAISNVNSNDLSFPVDGLKIDLAASKDAVQAINVEAADSEIDDTIAEKFKTFDPIFKDQLTVLKIITNNKNKYIGKYRFSKTSSGVTNLQLEYYDVDGNSSFVGNVPKLTDDEISIFSKNPEGYYKVTPDLNTGTQLIFVSKTSNKIIYTITSYEKYGKLFFNFNKYAKKALNFFDEIKKLYNSTISKNWDKFGTFYIQIWGGISLMDSSGNEFWKSEFEIPPLFKEIAAKNGFSKRGNWAYDKDFDQMYFGLQKDINVFRNDTGEDEINFYLKAEKIYILHDVSGAPTDDQTEIVPQEYDEKGEKIEKLRSYDANAEDEF